jgi:hypothetical protein
MIASVGTFPFNGNPPAILPEDALFWSSILPFSPDEKDFPSPPLGLLQCSAKISSLEPGYEVARLAPKWEHEMANLGRLIGK